jgi:hypothetical protein
MYLFNNLTKRRMAMSKKNIVVVESGIRASRMQDFWRMVGDGTIDGQIIDYVLDNIGDIRKKAGSILTLTRAINILGSEPGRVITPNICAKWGLPEMTLPIRYREQTLREAVESNKKGETDFHLVFFPGDMSLFRQREIRGTDSAKPPYFNSGNNWWLAVEEKKCQEKGIPYWAKMSPAAGFYLVDFKPRFAGMNWQKQEDEIAKLGSQYERTNEAVFLFAVQSIYMLTGKNVTSNWWHWGKTIDSDSYSVGVDLCDDGKASVNSDRLRDSGGSLRVSLSRKFEF